MDLLSSRRVWRRLHKNLRRTKFINAAEVKLINARIIGPARSSAHDDALLNKILSLPIRQEAYRNETNIHELASTLACNLIKHPVFPEGNKRTALLAAALFRWRHDVKPLSLASKADGNDAMVEVHRRLETGEIDEAEYAKVCSLLWKLPTKPHFTNPWSNREVKNGLVAVQDSCSSFTASDFKYESMDLTAVFDGKRLVYTDDLLVAHDYSGSVILRKAIFNLGLFRPN